MNLLFYINSIHEGGAERVMCNLCSYFANKGDNVVLVTSFIDKWEYAFDTKVTRISLFDDRISGNRIIRNFKIIKKLRQAIKQIAPDCVVSFMGEPNFRAFFASRFIKTKWVCSVRNDPKIEYSGIVERIFAKWLMPFSDGCVFQTQEAKNFFPDKLQRKSAIIMNAVDKRFFDVNLANVEKHDIITCGRLTSQKNHKLLIDAFNKIKDQTDENLIIYGNGELNSELQCYIRQLGIDNRVFLAGQTSNVIDSIKGAKIFVLSSDYEGMPNALLEAMAIGIPCISTNCPCGGPKEIIENGENGYLVPVRDEVALSGKMLMLLNDEKTQCKFANNARDFSINNVHPDVVYCQWNAFFEKVVSSKSGKRGN